MSAATRTSASVSRGQLDLPGASPESKDALRRLLKEDYDTHHCFFNTLGFHNHLNHHLFAAYDLGAPPKLLQAIYDKEARHQRPIDLGKPDISPKPGQVNQNNWTQWLGDQNAYHGYLAFFTEQLDAHGLQATLHQYIFSSAANDSGVNMLTRLVGGFFHPFIELGYGVEFGENQVVAQGMAQAAVSKPAPPALFTPGWPNDRHAITPASSKPPSLLSLLHEIYEHKDLGPPMPYNPDATVGQRIALILDDKKKIAALNAITSKWSLGAKDVDLAPLVQECNTLGALLLAATSRRGYRTRLDFFLMHTLTSSLFLPAILHALPQDDHDLKGAILESWWRIVALCVIARGRPRIDPGLLMEATAAPRPPSSPGAGNLSEDAVGFKDPEGAGGALGVNPWLDITADVLHAPDSHTVKTIRALMYGARHYSDLPTSAFVRPGEESFHQGAGKLDGTLFVRAAGLVMNTMGWVTHGQKAGSWDGSALGYDDAWKDERPSPDVLKVNLVFSFVVLP
ncbi:hypothetical protein BOTBODRAFT_104662 [Botryobasidium botryosum FD-172 SS1]|uniref:DUF4243 domain-containing protein n=1 Tax=Botryobasidium botryosum (strain FD-172 SS1) TaxID=930990 RepID=A0A067MRF1_BOTB1|nr:hypothetical protein BOTBODRAFT_104662 [Botryobasidium botryosum FD-172 SS1]